MDEESLRLAEGDRDVVTTVFSRKERRAHAAIQERECVVALGSRRVHTQQLGVRVHECGIA